MRISGNHGNIIMGCCWWGC